MRLAGRRFELVPAIMSDAARLGQRVYSGEIMSVEGNGPGCMAEGVDWPKWEFVGLAGQQELGHRSRFEICDWVLVPGWAVQMGRHQSWAGRIELYFNEVAEAERGR